jgi:hypothetical protein
MSEETSVESTVANASMQIPLSPIDEKDDKKTDAAPSDFGKSRHLTKPKHAKLTLADAQRQEKELSGRSKRVSKEEKLQSPIGALPEDKKIEAGATSVEKTPENVDEKPKEEVKPPAPEKKFYKVKVNGEEIEVDEEELTRGYQIRKASDRAFQEAAEMRKKAEAFSAHLRMKTS